MTAFNREINRSNGKGPGIPQKLKTTAPRAETLHHRGESPLSKSRRKRNRPSDPAEIARRNKEREAYVRRTPGEWGVNSEAMSREQNANIAIEAETRKKTARIYRWDVFALLNSRGGLGPTPDESLARLNGVRRYEEALAVRMRLEGTQGAGVGGGSPIPISDRSLAAGRFLDAIEASMAPFLHGLLLKLVSPAVQKGQTLNNWRKVVEEHSGEFRPAEQSRLVATAAGALLIALQAHDTAPKANARRAA